MSTTPTVLTRADVEARGFLIGEGLSMPAGDLAHAAHIDLWIGLLNGIAGPVFARILMDQKAGHTNLLATDVNILVPPFSVIVPKVTMTKSKQVLQMFCDAQHEVTQAFARAVKSGLIPKYLAPQLCAGVGVFIDKGATDSKLIREHNRIALDLAIERAVAGVRAEDMDALVDKCLAGDHPLTQIAADVGKKEADAATKAA